MYGTAQDTRQRAVEDGVGPAPMSPARPRRPPSDGTRPEGRRTTVTELRVHDFAVSLDGLDELHLAVVPVLLGSGERLLGDLGSALDGWACVEFVAFPSVARVRLRRDAGAPQPGTEATAWPGP